MVGTEKISVQQSLFDMVVENPNAAREYRVTERVVVSRGFARVTDSSAYSALGTP